MHNKKTSDNGCFFKNNKYNAADAQIPASVVYMQLHERAGIKQMPIIFIVYTMNAVCRHCTLARAPRVSMRDRHHVHGNRAPLRQFYLNIYHP